METLVAGVDKEEASLYSMDPVGSLLPDDYITAGSGAPIAIGILEAEYSKDLSVEKGAELAVKAIKAAIARDITSGDGIDILIIKEEEAEERTIPLHR
jgi:proteasome beta subunit